MIRATPFLLLLMLDIFCVIDIIVSRDDDVRHLPKIAWLLLVLIFPPVGAIAWLVAGRPTKAQRAANGPTTPFPDYDRPGRAAGVTPESDEEFLRRIRERAEEQRRRAAEEKKAREAEDDDSAP